MIFKLFLFKGESNIKMKSFTFEIVPKYLLENYDMEPSFCFESLDKKSLDDLFDFQHDINKPVLYPSFDFHGNIEVDNYGWIKANNLINDAPNIATLTNTVAAPINATISKSMPPKEEADPENSNLVQEKSENLSIVPRNDAVSALNEEDKSNAISDSESYGESSEDDEDYVEKCDEMKKNKRSSKMIYTQNIKKNRVKVKKQEGVALKRWDRSSDRDVFQFIRNQLKPTGIDIQEFIFDDTIKISDEKNQIILCEKRLEILEQAIKITGWINTPYFLFKRLKKSVSKQSFSFRESKQLRKIQYIIILNKVGNIKISIILFYQNLYTQKSRKSK